MRAAAAVLGGEPVDLLTDGIFKPTSHDENGTPTGYCFTNNGENLRFVNLNAGKGASPEDILKNMDQNIGKFQCDLPEFDTSEHDRWLAATVN